MCQYSSEKEDGKPTAWHMVHLGSRAVGGAGLVMVEATAVVPEGRITPKDLGIWSDEHIASFARIAKFISEQGATPGIQLAHAGRKASHDVPWAGNKVLSDGYGGWAISGPSPLPFDTEWPIPYQLTIEDMNCLAKAFGDAAGRAVQAGIEVIELHFAHGYLLCEFLSPLSNQRSDLYGGSFENRIRFPIQIVDEVRRAMPENMPLFVRLSCSEYMDQGWDIGDSVLFAKELKLHGVDLIDCSSGGNSPYQQLQTYPGYQVPFAKQIRSGSEILTGAVGLITDPKQAEEILISGHADVIFLGREFLRTPYWPLYAEKILDSKNELWKDQYARAIPR